MLEKSNPENLHFLRDVLYRLQISGKNYAGTWVSLGWYLAFLPPIPRPTPQSLGRGAEGVGMGLGGWGGMVGVCGVGMGLGWREEGGAQRFRFLNFLARRFVL